ncbi:MAG: D-aminoacylase [Ilumatobacteraceae bacterium]
MVTETVIQDTELYDGSGGPPRRTDVLIVDGRIAAVEPGQSTRGREVRPGRGLVLAPGFIDMHSHGDFTLPSYPTAINSLSQGVTTEVLGNCGWSPAPLSASDDHRRGQWSQAGSGFGPDLSWSWTDFGGFLDVLDAAHPAVNCAPLVGHGAIRTAAFGIQDRPPTADELAVMRELLAEAASAGAWGLSTGLVYPPSRFALADEINTLARDVASWGGMYATHMRGDETPLLQAVDEAIGVARETGVRVQISHLKAAGPASHGQVAEALDAIDRAARDGLAVGCDVYPYLAGNTVLTQLLPSWVLVGGVDALIGRLTADDTRRRIRHELQTDQSCYLNQMGGWEKVMVCAVGNERLKRFEGRFIPEIAAERGTDEATVLFDVLVEDRARTTMVVFLLIDADVDQVLDHPCAVIGSDGLGVVSATSRVHPRAYGSFARVIHRAIAKGGGALSDAIARCTGRTAERLGLSGRGLVRPGYIADLVLFDPAVISDQATYEDPTGLASGIDAVYVAGAPAIAEGHVVNSSLGRVLRRPR